MFLYSTPMVSCTAGAYFPAAQQPLCALPQCCVPPPMQSDGRRRQVVAIYLYCSPGRSCLQSYIISASIPILPTFLSLGSSTAPGTPSLAINTSIQWAFWPWPTPALAVLSLSLPLGFFPSQSSLPTKYLLPLLVRHVGPAPGYYFDSAPSHQNLCTSASTGSTCCGPATLPRLPSYRTCYLELVDATVCSSLPPYRVTFAQTLLWPSPYNYPCLPIHHVHPQLYSTIAQA